MKNKKSYILAIIMIMIFIVAGFTSEVNAGLQSNPTTYANPKTDSLESFIKLFRNIETSTGGLGYSETINPTTLLSTSGSNGIDIHVMKSTEYGAISILAVSGYGNPSNDSNITNTTGNDTGIMLHATYPSVVAGLSNNMFSNIDCRYYNLYGSTQATAKTGDGLGRATDTNPGTAGWRNSKVGWVINTSSYYFSRWGLFNFDNAGGGRTTTYIGRGVAVVGQGV